MLVRVLILVGLLTSILVTMFLYITIGDYHIPTDTYSPSYAESKSQLQLRGPTLSQSEAQLQLRAIDNVSVGTPFRCRDGSNLIATENDDYCDCTMHILFYIMF